MISLSQRTETFTDSVIRRMTRICAQYDAINLSQGFPDFDPPEELMKSLSRIAMNGPHQYAITMGSLNMRKALARKIEHFCGMSVDYENELAVTCGSTEAMMAAVLATLNEGDKVAIFSPFYENYGADAVLCGVEPIYVPLVPPAFNFDKEVLEKAFIDGAKALILCNPSNPCGKIFTKEELDIICSIVKKYDAFVITDEVYEHIVYKPHRHLYLHTFEGMKDKVIVCNSLSKTYSITGWRLGYVQGPKEVMDRVKQVHDFLTVGAAAPLQEAVVTALEFDDEYYEAMAESYEQKRKLFLDGLRSLNLKFYEPQGAYYVLVDIGDFNYKNDYDFAVDLIKKVGVGAVPGSSFFRENVNNYIRFHFAKKKETLLEALSRLENIRMLVE